MKAFIRKRLKASRRAEAATRPSAVQPPPAPGTLLPQLDELHVSSPGAGSASQAPAPGEGGPSPLSEALSQCTPAGGWAEVPTYFKSPPPAAQAPRREPITPEDAPQVVEGSEALQGLFAVDRQPRGPSLGEALAGGPPTAEQIDAAVKRAARPRQQEILPLPPELYARLCPGCRYLDGEHDFGPTCTLDPEPEEPRVEDQLDELQPDLPPDWEMIDAGAEDKPWVMRRKGEREQESVPLAPHSWEVFPPSAPPSNVEIVLASLPEKPPGQLALPGQPLGPADVRSYFLAGRAPSTRAAYASDLQHFARWRGLELDQALSDFLAGSAAQAHATALGWLQAMTVAKLSPATVARRLASLRSFVELAGQLGVVSWALLLKAPKVEAFRDTRGPGVDGVRQLLQHCGEGVEGLRNRALILVVFALGLRRSELAQLRLKDYDRAGSRLAVRGKGKGGQPVWMSLPREIAAELDRWLCESRQIACEGEGPLEQLDDEPLFHSLERKEQLSGEGIRYILNVVGKRAGVPVRPHGLRHAAVTAVLEETKGNIQSAQRFSRHADPKTVLKYDDNRQDLGGESAKLIARRVLEEK